MVEQEEAISLYSELCRRLVRKGRDLRVAAIDIDPFETPDPKKEQMTPADMLAFARKRDRVMAENILAVTEKEPDITIIVLAGSFHTRLEKGMPWDPEYEPMGYRLKKEVPGIVSVLTETSGGQAWVSSNLGIGPTNISGQDQGTTPFVRLFPKLSKAHNGFLYVGPITAAPPVHHPQ